MFRPIPYIEWFVEREGEATHDLARSDLRPEAPSAYAGNRSAHAGSDPDRTDGREDGLVPPRLAALPSPGPDVASAEDLLAERYDVATENVALTAGTSHANALLAATVLDHPDEVEPDDRSRVLVETPGYQPHHLTPESLGADAWRFRRDDGELDPDRVESAIDDTVDLVTVTNRHNPTGRFAARETLAEVARICADYDAILLVDEVYAPYTVADDDGPLDGPFGGVSAAGLPNTVVTNSLTKFFGFGGLRFGWAIGPPGLVADLESTARHIPDLAEPSRILGRRALANADALAADCRDLLASNHAILERFAADRDDLHGTVPTGSSFAVLRYSEDGPFDTDDRTAVDAADSSAVADADGEQDREEADRPDHGDRIVEAAWEHDVFVVPARFFGIPDAIRLSLGGPPEDMEAALGALGAVLDDL